MRVSRRNFILGTAGAALAGRTARAAGRPNVVLIVAGEMPAWLLGCYGNREVRTPNIDLLARSGSRLVSHTASSPSPAANWATLLTGRTPRQHGIQGLPGEAAPREGLGKEVMFSDVMAGAGATCGFAGAWLAGSADQPQHGFSFWRPAAGAGHGFAPEAITRDAAEFLNAQAAGRTFFLLVSYPAPQAPYEGHASKFDELYAGARFETLDAMDASADASEGRELLRDYIGSMRRYAASASALDSQIPGLIEVLDKRNLRDHTLVVFTSACGLMAGRHGLWRGGGGSQPPGLYAEAMETPMIWNSPGTVPVEGARGELGGAYDLLPSLTEAAGVNGPVGRALCGRSYLAAMLNNPYPPKSPCPNRVFAAHGAAEMARDARYKLVLRDRGETPGELYDLRTDARERVNQYANDRFLTVRHRLAEAIREWREQHS